MEMLEEHRCFGGWQQRWRHHAATLNCAMTFSIFLPPTQDNEPPPVLYWLSGGWKRRCARLWMNWIMKREKALSQGI